MKKGLAAGIILIIALVVFVGFQVRRANATPQLRHVVLTTEQNKPLLEVDAQLKQLAQQSEVLKARAAGMLEVYAAQAGLAGKPYRLTEMPGGGYALDEVPPQPQEGK